MHTLSANTRTPRPRGIAKIAARNGAAAGSWAAATRSVCAAALVLSLIAGGAPEVLAQSTHSRKKQKKVKKPAAIPCRIGCVLATANPGMMAGDTPEDQARQKELATLARQVHNAAPGAYNALAEFQGKNAANVWGARAALALGYEDHSHAHEQQALAWFTKSSGDTLLREYVLYWTAQAKHGLGRSKDALADLETVEHDYPNTAMKEQLLESLAPLAIELGQAQDAIDALNSYPATGSRPTLLLERAQAYQSLHQLPRAAKDYQAIFYKNSQSEEAKPAEIALKKILHEMGKEYPYPGVELQQQRAQAFYDVHKWKEARAEFEKFLGMLQDPLNPNRQLAELRSAEARVQLKGSPKLVATLKTPDFEVDAERLYALSQFYRSDKKFDEMFATLGELTQKYPLSKWNEEGFMAAGNYYWVELDRSKAASYYQRVLDTFPSGRNAFNAEWRVAWVAYLNRQPDAEDKIKNFLVKYPASANTPDAVYWLGRDAERNSKLAEARSYYRKDMDRFPQTYFGHAAAARLSKLEPADGDPPEILDKIPPPPSLRPFDEPIPVAAADRWARAQALRTIAFDASAELELKNAYFATSSPRFLYEAAQAAFDQGHFAAGMAYGRIIVPNFDARKIDDLPINVWKVLYPLPYEAAIRREAAKNNFDPLLAAGLMRQESTFQADALSPTNAIGLMQVEPKTGKLLAKQLRVSFSTKKLFDPEYNIQLGMLYISGLVKLTGAPEYALAAFDAGEDRIAAWKAERNYEEIPELVESIPFSETRDYVQIVLRNSEVYRMIYGQSGAPAASSSAAGHGR
ncbi:MAG TPA: transglycosylase SLT domain-containing protein [Verrucomicrobiae bacterium]|nr:transglycosylase SLT domain-containing protein [Verrucomicrobiae bacterium]